MNNAPSMRIVNVFIEESVDCALLTLCQDFQHRGKVYTGKFLTGQIDALVTGILMLKYLIFSYAIYP